MKKILGLILILALIGCASVKVTNKDSNAYKVGKMAGIFVYLNDEDFATAALPYAEGLLMSAQTGELTSKQVIQALSFISGKFKNDSQWKTIYAAFILEVGVKVEMGEINGKLIEAMKGFVDGLKVAEEELC